MNTFDNTLQPLSDAIYRGGGQIIPTARRVCYAATLLADPGIQEPMYLLEILCPDTAQKGVYVSSVFSFFAYLSATDSLFFFSLLPKACLLNIRKAHVFSSEQRGSIPLVTMKVYLPVSESFGFHDRLVSLLSCDAGLQLDVDLNFVLVPLRSERKTVPPGASATPFTPSLSHRKLELKFFHFATRRCFL